MRSPAPADSGGSGLGSHVVGSSGADNPVADWGMRARHGASGPHHRQAGDVVARGRGSGGSGADGPKGPVQSGPFFAAPVADSLAVQPDGSERLSDAGIAAGGCFVRPLPMDMTCAATARRYFREALSSLSLPSGLLHDGVTMTSELAANTLHAYRNVALGSAQHLAAAGVPEIWVYLRGSGRACELVCKVFDTERSWTAGSRPGMSDAPVDSVSGRGLQVVAGLSAGQWGCHLTRSRLGTWKLPGKAVWFALRIPSSAVPDYFGRPRYPEDWLVDQLEAMLTDRGLSGSIVRADMGHLTVLSISRYLTVWRQAGQVCWRTQPGTHHRMPLSDLVEATEQIVSAHEEAALEQAAVV